METSEPEGEVAAYRDVMHQALDRFYDACEKVGLPSTGIAHVEIDSETYLERDLEREPEGYLGVSEVAAWLDVSRQRISELRTRPGFPAPLAEIAAGPVWTESSLKRFVETWDRKPGRRRRVRRFRLVDENTGEVLGDMEGARSPTDLFQDADRLHTDTPRRTVALERLDDISDRWIRMGFSMSDMGVKSMAHPDEKQPR